MYFLTLLEGFHCQSISKCLYVARVLVCTFSWGFFPENQAHILRTLQGAFMSVPRHQEVTVFT